VASFLDSILRSPARILGSFLRLMARVTKGHFSCNELVLHQRCIIVVSPVLHSCLNWHR
jgi:hypothetical protein